MSKNIPTIAPDTIRNIAAMTEGLAGSMKGYSESEIRTIIDNTNRTTGSLTQHSQNVINNISIDTSSIGYAMTQHSQNVVNTISNSLNRLTSQLSQHTKDIIIDTSALSKGIRDDNQLDRLILKQTLEGVSELQRDNIREIGKRFSDSLTEAMGKLEINEKDVDRLAKPFWNSLLDALSDLFPALENRELIADILFEAFPINSFLGYFIERSDNFLNVLDKLSKYEYDTLDDFWDDLLDSDLLSDTIQGFWWLLTIVPTFAMLIQANLFPYKAALSKLELSSYRPQLPNINEILIGQRRGIFGDKKAYKMLSDSGWSDDLQKLMFELSATQPIFTELAELYRRGLIDDRLLEGNIEALGYDKNWVPLIKELVYFIPSPQDVIRFSVRDVFDEQLANLSGIFEGWDNPDYLEYTRQAGIKDEDARLYWGAHWIYPSVQMGYEMLQRGIISRNELEALLRAADIAPRWRDKLVAISYKVPTRVDNRNMFLQGVITEQETLANIKGQGYDDFNAQQLLNWYKQIKAEQNNDNGNVKQLSQTIILKSVRAGIMSDNEALQRLVDIGYNTQDAARLLLLNTTEQNVENEIDYIRAQQKRLRGIYEKSYMNRTISKQEARGGLIKTGLLPEQAEAMLSLLDMEYNIERKSTIVEQATKLYVGYEYTDNDYRTTMVNYGFTSDEIEAQIRDLEPFRKLRYRDLTTKQISGAVTEGLRSIQWGENQLRGNGFSDNDIETIKELEQWEIPQVIP